MSETNYLRPTGINTFLECSARYLFQEVEKVQTPNKLALAFGSAIHKSLQVNYEQKVETKKDLPVETVKDAFSDSFNDEFERVDKMDFEEEKPGVLKDQGISLIEKYQKNVAPRIQPLAVEQKVKVKFKNYDFGLTGTIDLYDDDFNIVDHKTTKKEIKDIPAAYIRQISAYTILEEALNREVRGARIDFLRRDSASGGEIRHLAVNIDREHFLTIFQIVSDAINKGAFIPNRNSFLCSKKYCKFYAECEKRFGGKVKE